MARKHKGNGEEAQRMMVPRECRLSDIFLNVSKIQCDNYFHLKLSINMLVCVGDRSKC